MRKWVVITVILLVCIGVTQIISDRRTQVASVQVIPTRHYMEEKEVSSIDHSDYYSNESERLPATLQKDKTIPKQEPKLYGIAIGDSEELVITRLGHPIRREASSLGYDWLVYKSTTISYVQVGILRGKVVDIYSNAKDAKFGETTIGTPYSLLAKKHPVSEKVSFPYKNANVEITNQIQDRPLILENSTPVVFYLDTMNQQKVAGIRLLDQTILLQGSFYETRWTYRGTSPDFDAPVLTPNQQDAADRANARQILDLMNVVRARSHLPLLTWNEQIATVARAHSKDMENHQFFDHKSQTTGLNPFARLSNARISYRMAGENIAAGFPDAIEAFHSWLNSPSHRKNVLQKEFTQMGAGVWKDYYTQDFITAK